MKDTKQSTEFFATKELKTDFSENNLKSKDVIDGKNVKHQSKMKARQCDSCDITFHHATDLRIHTDSVHKKLKNYQCSLCSKFFSQPTGLRIHTKTVHEKTSSNICPYCNKLVSRRDVLRSHIERFHTERQFNVCQICQKKYIDAFALKEKKNSWQQTKKEISMSELSPYSNEKS